ncbi:MAG TPA: hypothetical protein VIM13_08405 [Clostridia bacterium]
MDSYNVKTLDARDVHEHQVMPAGGPMRRSKGRKKCRQVTRVMLISAGNDQSGNVVITSAKWYS